MGREHRQNPRWPNSAVWSDEERDEHRRERDRIIREAGLGPDDGDSDDDTPAPRGEPAPDES